MKNFAIYLRKSRADAELERQGQGETLARHRKALLELAKNRGYNIVKIYEEIVSGETIVSRPQMQALMSDVEQGLYAGVLVMEIERLARGDTIDQGLVAQTFKCSGTLIITPSKTYDPNNDFDEEFFEFGLFMSRREYKTINRRLQRGREASAREGKWLFPVAPYGYKRKPLTDQKGATLEPIEEQAAIVRLIFDLYVNGIDGRRLGCQAIAHRLNDIGIPPARRDYWVKETISDILLNPVYAGKIRYGYRRTKKIVVNGQKKITRPLTSPDDCIIAEGLHPAIVPPDLFAKVQEYAEERPVMPVGYRKEIQNPLAGLIICKLCGRKMTLRRATTPNKPDYIVCHARACPNVSAPFPIVESRVIDGLRDWLSGYEVKIAAAQPNNAHENALKAAISAHKKELETLTKQLDRAYDLLEQGIYTIDTFTERSRTLSERAEAVKADISRLTQEADRITRQKQLETDTVPHVRSILQAYEEAPTAADKNRLLREILEKVTYYKARSGSFRGVSADDFEIELFPKLPKK